MDLSNAEVLNKSHQTAFSFALHDADIGRRVTLFW